MSREEYKKFFDGISMTAAIITILAYLVLVINAQWPFLGNVPTIYNILVVIRAYAPLVVVALVGFEWVSKMNFVVRLVFYAAIALIIISMFFPATWVELVGLVQ